MYNHVCDQNKYVIQGLDSDNLCVPPPVFLIAYSQSELRILANQSRTLLHSTSRSTNNNKTQRNIYSANLHNCKKSMLEIAFPCPFYVLQTIYNLTPVSTPSSSILVPSRKFLSPPQSVIAILPSTHQIRVPPAIVEAPHQVDTYTYCILGSRPSNPAVHISHGKLHSASIDINGDDSSNL